MAAQSSSIPPKIPARPSLGLFVAIIVGFAGIAAAAVLFFFDPTKNNFYPVCQFHALTGFYCPGCGGTRATYQLLHGNLLMALHENAFYVVTLVALAIRGLWYGKQKICQEPAGLFVSPAALWVFLILGVVFGMLRNLPACAFLAPI
jgi:hypothetical protein